MRIDATGTFCLGIAVVAGVLVLVWGGTMFTWTSPVILGLITVAGITTATLVAAERRATEPVLPPRLFGDRAFIATIGAGAALAVAMFGTVNYLPTYLQMVHGLTPTRAGLFMLTLVAGLGGATVASGRIVQQTRRPKALPVVGASLVCVALLIGSQLDPQTPLPVVGGCLLFLGAGIGCAWQVLVVVAQDLAPADDLGVATAANGFVRELGVLIGTAWVGRMFTAGLVDRLGPMVTQPGQLTPEAIRTLDPTARAIVAQAYADSFTPVFGWLLPVLVLATLALVLVPSRTLGTGRPRTARSSETSRVSA